MTAKSGTSRKTKSTAPKRESPVRKSPIRKSYVPGDFELEVRRSTAGLGLFTLSAIPKGACVIEYRGKELTEEELESVSNRYLFEISAKRTIDGSPRWNTARYINHSCRPNCEPEVHRGRVFIRARRGIKPGEELTYNYGPNYFRDFIEPYGCRCTKCAEKRSRTAS